MECIRLYNNQQNIKLQYIKYEIPFKGKEKKEKNNFKLHLKTIW